MELTYMLGLILTIMLWVILALMIPSTIVVVGLTLICLAISLKLLRVIYSALEER